MNLRLFQIQFQTKTKRRNLKMLLITLTPSRLNKLKSLFQCWTFSLNNWRNFMLHTLKRLSSFFAQSSRTIQMMMLRKKLANVYQIWFQPSKHQINQSLSNWPDISWLLWLQLSKDNLILTLWLLNWKLWRVSLKNWICHS